MSYALPTAAYAARARESKAQLAGTKRTRDAAAAADAAVTAATGIGIGTITSDPAAGATTSGAAPRSKRARGPLAPSAGAVSGGYVAAGTATVMGDGGSDENVAPAAAIGVSDGGKAASAPPVRPAAAASVLSATVAPARSGGARAGPEFTPAAVSAFIGKARAIINNESLPAALGSRTKNDLLLRKQAEVLFLREYIAGGGAGDTAAQLHDATKKLHDSQMQVTMLSTDKAKLSVEVTAKEMEVKEKSERLRRLEAEMRELERKHAAALTATTNAAATSSDDPAAAVIAIKMQHAAEVAALQARFDAAAGATQARHDAATAQLLARLEAAEVGLAKAQTDSSSAAALEAGALRTQHRNEIAELRALHAGELATLRQEHEDGFTTLQEEFAAKVRAMEAEHAAAATREAAAAAAHASRLHQMEAAFASERQALQRQMEDLRSELEDLTSEHATYVASKSSLVESLHARVSELESGLATAAAETTHMRARFDACDAKRVALLEETLTLKGGIRVLVRVRPILPGEGEGVTVGAAAGAGAGAGTARRVPAARSDIKSEEVPLLQFPDARDDASVVELVEKPGAGVGGYGVGEAKRHRFAFQRVFTPLDGQGEVFHEVEGVVHAALTGRRVCIFAYGQTGSGKTHTMMGAIGGAGGAGSASGANEEWGLIPRSVEYVFHTLERMREQGWSAKLSVEMLEIYNEDIRDLLAPTAGASAASGKLDIRHDKDGNTTVPGLTTREVATAGEIVGLLVAAAAARATGATHSNAVSSRSHSVFTLRLQLRHAATAATRHGVLNLIDLAGSERIAKSGVNATGEAGGSDKLLRETQNINKSLSCLSTVIMALRAGQAHIPYRNSKLTHLLQHSLGGDCKTLLICNVNPLHTNAHESLCTLRFAKGVAEVQHAGSKGSAATAGVVAAGVDSADDDEL